jgi:hypothetical protein
MTRQAMFAILHWGNGKSEADTIRFLDLLDLHKKHLIHDEAFGGTAKGTITREMVEYVIEEFDRIYS